MMRCVLDKTRHKTTYWNLSMQSMPLGSSVEYTKQLNAALNSSPQGPCAMPPRHGQSQLISPVSGLNAPCWPASSSSSSGVLSVSPGAATASLLFSGVGVGGCDSFGAAAAAAAASACSCLALRRASSWRRFSSTIASTVGKSDSENCGGSVESWSRRRAHVLSVEEQAQDKYVTEQKTKTRTWQLVGKHGAGVVPV